MSGARAGSINTLRRLVSRTMARDLTAFVVPDVVIARLAGLDLAAAGLRLAPTPRHASVLLVVGPLPDELGRAAGVVYAQMPRPRMILAVGAVHIEGLPPPDAVATADQPGLAAAVVELRRAFADAAFSLDTIDLDLDAVRTHTQYVCPMHPEIVRDEPGSCPICGMFLVPQQAGAPSTASPTPDHAMPAMEAPTPTQGASESAEGMYTCSMHPEIVQAGPGRCPLCGMALVPTEDAAGVPDDDEAPTRQAPRPETESPHDVTYTCPMHPEVVQHTPGSCPLCGMDLVPQQPATSPARHDHSTMDMQHDAKTSEAATPAEGTYVCPMHPEVVRSEPGACPICGMALVPRDSMPEAMQPDTQMTHDADAHEPHTPGATTYTCPMHPEIVQDEPGSCPICGMALVPREDSARERAADHDTAHGPTAAEDQPSRVANDHRHAGDSGDTADAPSGHDHAGMDHAAMGHGDAESMQPTMEHGTMEHGTMEHGTMDHAGMDHGQMDHASTAGGVMDHAAMGHEGMDQSGMGHENMDHAAMGHGDMDHSSMDHGGGFMSMVAMTKDLPRSRDGLPMEWLETPFGPLFPGLPGGLKLSLTLDGDTVAKARVVPGAARRDLDADWPGPADTLPERLDRLDRLAPGAYAVLARRALDAVAGAQADEATRRARVGALERARALSHYGWLSAFGALLGDQWLTTQATQLQRALLQAGTLVDIARVRDAAARFERASARLAFVSNRIEGVGRLEAQDVSNVRGPVARAAGVSADARSGDPIYQQLGFAPVTRDGGDAAARLWVRLAETIQSLELVLAAGAFALDSASHMPDLSGAEAVTIEAPRGEALAHAMFEHGRVTAVHLLTPSSRLADLVPTVAEGAELADALLAVASLDISPWELDR